MNKKSNLCEPLSFSPDISGIVLLIAGLGAGLLCVISTLGTFSPDSYSYYDIAKTFSGKFGLVNTIRQYVVRSDYNCSFPYFYPFLIWIVNLLTGLGIYSGVLINVLLMLATAILFLKISKRITGDFLCGGLVSFFLFTEARYLDEVVAARSIPLSIFLTTIASAILCKYFLSEKNFSESFKLLMIIGLLNGLNMMTRFDQISAVAYFLLMIFLASSGKRIISSLVYIVSVAVPVFPWCIYSIMHFEKLYFTDNNGTALMVNANVPSYVFLPDVIYDNLLNAPEMWLQALFHKIAQTFSTAFSHMLFPFVVLLVLAVFGMFQYAKRHKGELHQELNIVSITNRFRSLSESGKKSLFILGATVLYAIAKLLMYALVGYIVGRYYVEVMLLSFFIVLIVLYNGFHKKFGKHCPLVTGIILILSFVTFLVESVSSVPDFRQLNMYEQKTCVQELDETLQLYADSDDAVLLLGSSMDSFSFGGLTNWKTYVSPENVSVESVTYTLATFADVQWIALGINESEEVAEYLGGKYDCITQEYFYLYKICKNKTGECIKK